MRNELELKSKVSYPWFPNLRVQSRAHRTSLLHDHEAEYYISQLFLSAHCESDKEMGRLPEGDRGSSILGLI